MRRAPADPARWPVRRAGRDRSADLRGAPRQGRGVRRRRARRGRRCCAAAAAAPGRPRAGRRLLLPAHDPRPLHHRDVGGPGGVVRPGAHRRDVPRRGRGRARSPTTPTYGLAGAVWTSDDGQGRAGGVRPARRHGLDQRLPPLRRRRRSGAATSSPASGASSACTGSPSTARPSTSGSNLAPAAAALVRWLSDRAPHPHGGRRMSGDRYDFVIVGGGSAGSALANRLSADPGTRVLVLEAGRSDFIWDPFIHMPAALPFPIGSRLYDWKYESEPEPYMNGRRIFHARGKVLGGSSSINGMIFQRGNPMDYERWGADKGMETWDFAHCLPYFKRMETLPGRGRRVARRQRPARARARPGDQPAVRGVLRGGPAGRLPAHRRRQRVPAGGLRQVRPQHPPRTPAQRGTCLPAPGDGPQEPRRSRRWRTPPRWSSRASARSASSTCAPARSQRSVRAGEVILCGGAINTPQLLQLSGVGDAEPTCGRSASTSSPTCRAWAPTCRTTSRSTSSTPASCRSRSLPGSPGGSVPGSAPSGCSPAQGLGATNHFEGGGFVRSNDDVDYPNLMFHFLPIAIRYDGTSPDRGPRLPGAHRSDVLRRPRLR